MGYVIFTTLMLFYSLIFYGASHCKRTEKRAEVNAVIANRGQRTT